MGHQNDLLAGQKRQKRPRPVKRTRFRVLSILDKAWAWLFPLALTAGIVWFLKHHLSSLTMDVPHGNPVITVLSEKNKILADPDTQEKILRAADLHLHRGGREGLLAMARQVLSGSSYGRIIVHKEPDARIRIFLKKLTPEFLISADQHRLVSEDGAVFGSSGSQDLPELRGIFSDRETPFRISHVNFVLLTGPERQRVRDAVLLKKKLADANFTLQKVVFRKYRGYFATLSPSDTVVSFGNAPFEVKINKLTKIIQDLSARGRYARRIELDYTDKAFVKEKLF